MRSSVGMRNAKWQNNHSILTAIGMAKTALNVFNNVLERTFIVVALSAVAKTAG